MRRRQARPHPQSLERGRYIAIPLKGAHLPFGTLRILLQDNGQVAIYYAVAKKRVYSTRPCGPAKGYAEADKDSEGKRHGEGLGDRRSAESSHQTIKGKRRNQLRMVAESHAVTGHHRKAATSGRKTSATKRGADG